MAHQFVTLSRDDESFAQYIQGRFSRQLRALPVHSFQPFSQKEKVTFKIVDRRDLDCPHRTQLIWQTLRPAYLSLTLSPLLVVTWMVFLASRGVLSRNWIGELTAISEVNWVHGILAAGSLLALHFAAFLWNDYFDHLNGSDRINPERGSQVIQKGWVPAYQIRLWAWFQLSLACALAAPLLWNQSWNLWLLSTIVAFVILSFSRVREKGLKEKGLGDLLVFLFLGPLLTGFFASILLGQLHWLWFLLGLIFGGLAMLTYQLRQFEGFTRQVDSRSRSLVTRLGFDRAKTFLFLETSVIALGGSVVLF